MPINGLIFLDPFGDANKEAAALAAKQKKIKERNLILTEEIASLEMELDNVEWLDFEDTDYLDILEEIGRSQDPSQVRTQQIWAALLNENRAEQDGLVELNNRSLVKRHNDLQAMV